MGGLNHAEHVAIRALDLDGALRFYRDVLGLRIVQESGGRLYLGCGMDDSFDIALVAGGRGLDHFCIRVDSLDDCESRLKNANIPFRRAGCDEPGISEAIGLDLPNGAKLELVAPQSDRGYHRPTLPKMANRCIYAPVDLDHVTLMSTDVRADASFLEEGAGLKVTEARDAGNDKWVSAFLRYRYKHHDAALLTTQDRSKRLHHLALTFVGLEHVKQALDAIAQGGFGIEVPPFRHVIGSNISAYLWEPSGNRVELCTEMATVSYAAPSIIWGPGKGPPICAWGPIALTDSYRNEGS